jgi:hypothetical protein
MIPPPRSQASYLFHFTHEVLRAAREVVEPRLVIYCSSLSAAQQRG